MSHKTWIWIAFGLLLGIVAIIQFIPDASGRELSETSPSDIST